MARFYYEPGTNESALLIGETGRSLDSSYGLNGTSTKEANCISFLSDTYGIQFKRTPIDYAKIIKSIKIRDILLSLTLHLTKSRTDLLLNR